MSFWCMLYLNNNALYESLPHAFNLCQDSWLVKRHQIFLFSFGLRCHRTSAVLGACETQVYRMSGSAALTWMAATGALEKPPRTRNFLGVFSEGSHTPPKRAPPSGSQNNMNVFLYMRWVMWLAISVTSYNLT
jgi:hypothetical protein